MKTLFLLPLILLSYSFINMNDSSTKGSTIKHELGFNTEKRKPFFDDDCITAKLEHINKDIYAIKVYNKCDSNYKVHYQVIDPVNTFYPSDINVPAKGNNTPGTIHCSEDAVINIISKVSY